MIAILFTFISYGWAAPNCQISSDFARVTREGLNSAIESADRLRTHPERFVVGSDKFAEVDRAARIALNIQAEEHLRALKSCGSDCIHLAHNVLQCGSLLFDAIRVEIDCSALEQNLKEELKGINVQVDHVQLEQVL